MADALMMSPTIVNLNLADNPLGPKGAATLVKAASLAAKMQAAKVKLAKAAFIQAEKDKQAKKERLAAEEEAFDARAKENDGKDDILKF